MHFHLYDVQMINRVGWDGIIRAPGTDEIGWKDTVKVAPLEDTIIAMRPIIPKLPFAVPDSIRLLDPTMPEGSSVGFNQTSPAGNLAITNVKVNMGWEYVWHCHLLSHEEMDMMRPVDVAVTLSKPDAPVLTQSGGSTTFTWTDPTPVGTTIATWGNLKNENGFRLERARVTNNVTGPYATVGTALANHLTADDALVSGAVPYKYRVVAYNTAGETASNVLSITYPVYTLSGKVTAAGVGLNGAVVTLYTASGTNLANVTTSGSGNNAGGYSFQVLAGNYKLYVQPNLTGYANQWFGGADQAHATVLPVTAATSQNIILTGAASYSLSGKLTLSGGASNGQALVGAKVSVYDAFTGKSLQTVTSTTGGNYTITLIAGSYKLYIQTNKGGYANQWVGVGATGIGTAEVINVTGALTKNISVHT
jgi:hypothetical protein